MKFQRHIFVCTNERSPEDPRGCCLAKGSLKIHALFKEELKKAGLEGKVRANKAGCLDQCAKGPSVVIYPEGVWYTVQTENDVKEIVQKHIIKGHPVKHLRMP
jgi:(2Fe-2S) ferredoxin